MNGTLKRSRRPITATALALAFTLVVLAGARAFAAPPQVLDAPRSRLAPMSTKNAEVGVNFGLLQLGLGGFNAAGELRYHRLWLEYSHGMALTLNNLGGFGLTQTERDQDLHVRVPFTTGFGVGFTLVKELWLGAEFKAHGYEVNAPGGPVSHYKTYSIGPVLGYKQYIWKGLYADAYGRYWPNVATSLHGGTIALDGIHGTVEHAAHDFGLFANISLGYMFRRAATPAH
jgi:hypothetical protein